MADVPVVGGDKNTWGSKLNTFLAVAHDVSGSNGGKARSVDTLYNPSPGTVQTDVQSKIRKTVHISDFADDNIGTAITAISTTLTTLYIDKPITYSSSLVIPSTVDIVILAAGSMDITSGTITINGGFFAGYRQVFYGNGSISFSYGSVDEVYHIWFGHTVAGINKALVSAGRTTVRVIKSMTLESCILIGSNQTLDLGNVILTANASVSDPMIRNIDISAGNSNILIKGGFFEGLGATQTVSKAVIHFKKVTDGVLFMVKVNNSGSYIGDADSAGGIFVEDSARVKVLNCTSNNSYNYCGLYVLNSSHVDIDGGDYINDTGVYGNSNIAVNTSPYSSVTRTRVINSAGSHISFNSKNGRVLGNLCIGGAQSLGFGITTGHDSSIYSADNTIVEGNSVFNMKKYGILCQGDTTNKVVISTNNIVGTDNIANGSEYGIYVSSDNASLIGNNIENVWRGMYVISTTVGKGSVFNNNSVDLCRDIGVVLSSERNTLIGNKVTNSTGAGIYVGASSHYNIITENSCYSNTSPKTQTKGIDINSNNNIVKNNMLVGNLTNGFTNNAYNNIIEDNLTDTNTNIGVIDILDNTGTPSVLNLELAYTGGTTLITNLINGTVGQVLTILSVHIVTLKHTAGILHLSGGLNFDMVDGSSITLRRIANGVWREVSRLY